MADRGHRKPGGPWWSVRRGCGRGLAAMQQRPWTSGTNWFEFRWRTDFEDGVVVQTDQFGGMFAARRLPGARTGPLFDSTAEPLRPLRVPSTQPFVDDTASLLRHFLDVVAGVQA